jgi:hypothetical protein
MKWGLAALILAACGVILRRLLSAHKRAAPCLRGLVPLGEERAAIFQPVAEEIETQATMLGISLNDAYEERDAGHADLAWRLVCLSASEWDRLAEFTILLLKAVTKHVPYAQVAIPARSVVADHFKSQAMTGFVQMHELLDQLVFRSNLRFLLHLRMLRRAAETLRKEFRRAFRYADRTGDRPQEFWGRLDLYFHDFDLVSKEALLSFRTLLLCLPSSRLPALVSDLKPALRRGVRATPLRAGR